MTQGFVYILSNNSMPGLLKIGKSKDGGFLRSDDLYTTGVPEPYVVLKEALVSNMNVVEKNLHTLLKDYRPNPDREFFKIDYDKCMKLIEETYSEIEWSEPKNINLTRKSKDYWKNYQEELNALKTKAENFEKYAEENKWFEHKDCYDGDILTRAGFKTSVLQLLDQLQRGLNNRPEAVEQNSKFLKEDDKSLKEDLKKVNKRLAYYEERYSNWPNYTGPCLCNSHTYERTKVWPQPECFN